MKRHAKREAGPYRGTRVGRGIKRVDDRSGVDGAGTQNPLQHVGHDDVAVLLSQWRGLRTDDGGGKRAGVGLVDQPTVVQPFVQLQQFCLERFHKGKAFWTKHVVLVGQVLVIHSQGQATVDGSWLFHGSGGGVGGGFLGGGGIFERKGLFFR